MRRNWFPLFLLLPALLGQSPAPKGDSASQEAARSKRERLLEIYTKDAAEYSIYHNASRKERVELQRNPVYVWTNPVRDGGQDGVVFVWTCRGKAEVLGTFFSFPATGPRKLCHELHSLSLSVLDVSRPRVEHLDARGPGHRADADRGRARARPLRPATTGSDAALTHDFSASTKDDKERSWELRLLPQPLYRYKSTDPDVVDGALFAFVTSAGTDPEALLVIEARKSASMDAPVWQYAVARFTDLNLWVRHKDNEVYFAPLIPYGFTPEDPKHRYRLFSDRNIPAVESH